MFVIDWLAGICVLAVWKRYAGLDHEDTGYPPSNSEVEQPRIWVPEVFVEQSHHISELLLPAFYVKEKSIPIVISHCYCRVLYNEQLKLILTHSSNGTKQNSRSST